MGATRFAPGSVAQVLSANENRSEATDHNQHESSHADQSFDEKGQVVDNDGASSHSGSDDDSINKIDKDAQFGVQSAQALTHIWSKRDLILAYAM